MVPPLDWCLGATRVHSRRTGSAGRSPPAWWPPAERLVRQPPDHGAARRALTSAAAAPSIGLDDPARRDRPVGLKPLPDHLESELVEAAERGQVRASEGSVRHVEIFQVDSVRTSILGRPRPLPDDRRADPGQILGYTLICEEPLWGEETWLRRCRRGRRGGRCRRGSADGGCLATSLDERVSVCRIPVPGRR